MKTLKEYFNELNDNRQSGKVKHLISEILVIALCAVCSGVQTVFEIGEFAEVKKDWLKNEVGLLLENGVPSHDTIGRVLAMINPKQFQSLFISWIEQSLNIPAGSYIHIDGKTLRGSASEQSRGIHLVSAFAHEAGVVLGQVKCAEKSNEITAIPELLNLLKLKSSIITIDAMGCQKEIAKEITKKKCDYVLALKENQPAAYNDVKDYFSIEDKDFQNTLLRFETLDIGHGREEKREYFLSTNINWFADKNKWANLKSFGMVKSTVRCKGKQYSEKRYFISSIEDINEFVTAVRTHWTIENTLHWSLDVIFRDDECQIREKNTAENIAILRRICFNRMKMYQNGKTLKRKKMLCTFDDSFRFNVLFS